VLFSVFFSDAPPHGNFSADALTPLIEQFWLMQVLGNFFVKTILIFSATCPKNIPTPLPVRLSSKSKLEMKMNYLLNQIYKAIFR